MFGDVPRALLGSPIGNERLQMLSADLVELVREHGGRRTQAAACRLAVTAAGVDDPRAAQSLEALSSGGPAESWHEVSQCLAD